MDSERKRTRTRIDGMKEIGSDFWKAELKKNDIRFFLSGRTALEYIIRDICTDTVFDSVLLPSYCCHTMIEPFVRHGMDIRFYDVYYSQGKLCADIPEPQKREIFFLIEYFGYSKLFGIKPEFIHSQWNCVVEDCTHSWLMMKDSKEFCDYRFTSYRKWTGTGSIATAEKIGDCFHIEKPSRVNKRYEQIIWYAERKKQEYIEESRGDKSAYLKMFQKAEELLTEDYVDCIPEYETLYRLINLNADMIRMKRRENAEILLEYLGNIEGIVPMVTKMELDDAPLFVPIMINPNKRDLLRKYLIEQQIYCPVHWPISNLHQISERAKEIYHIELSLVCDQRYGKSDMDRMAKALNNFF